MESNGKSYSCASPCNASEFVYDLYALCNHYGNLHGGHYTGRSLYILYLCYICQPYFICSLLFARSIYVKVIGAVTEDFMAKCETLVDVASHMCTV